MKQVCSCWSALLKKYIYIYVYLWIYYRFGKHSGLISQTQANHEMKLKKNLGRVLKLETSSLIQDKVFKKKKKNCF